MIGFSGLFLDAEAETSSLRGDVDLRELLGVIGHDSTDEGRDDVALLRR